MGCVNKSSREFIRLAKSNNLDERTLELITHKYWLESGSEELFPSSIYIQAQLGNTEYEESMPTVRDFWQKAYSKPKTFTSEEEYRKAWVQTIPYFPKKAIVNYKDANGDFVLVVRKPVERLSIDGKMSPVYDAEGNMIPAITEQEERDYEIINREIAQNSEKSATFAPTETKQLNQKVLANLEQTLQLERHEGRTEGNARTAGEGQSSADGGLLGESQAIISRGNQSLRETEEQGVLTPKEWTPKRLKALEYLVKGIENGKFNYQRFPQEAAEGFHRGGEVHEAASLLLRGNDRANEKEPQNLSSAERYERDKREQPVQEAIVENWAKAQGVWFDSIHDATRGMEHYEDRDGGEAKIYRKDGHTIRKVLSTEYFITPQFALDRITLHNTLFPAAPLKVIGFGRDEDGNFQFIVDQPFIEGTAPTTVEIEDFMKKAGFKKSNKDRGNTYTTESIYASDLHNENVIKTPKGNLVVIDADLRLNTPDLQRGGTYKINNSIVLAEKKEAPKQPTKKERQVIGPQPFTFNDGIMVTVPFKPNEQQTEALNIMNDFIHSNETSMTLSGYAGTGKTSLMEIIAQKMRREHKPIMFSATTNKAAAVLKSRVSKAGFDAQTLNKVFGINVEVDSSKAYNARNLVTALREANITPGTTVIIDEASMINEENYKILNRVARENGLKIIYVGDKAQLAPVNETQVSKVFRNNEGRVVELTQVERTDDNAILKEATNIRNGLPLSGETSFNEKGEGVAFLTPKSREEIGRVIRHYIQGLKDNPNFFRILAYTNKKVTGYNDYVRGLLGYTDPIPQVGEPLTGYSNWGYDRYTRGYRFINSESYKVTRVGKPAQSRISVNGQNFTMTYVPVTMENSLGESDTFNYMDIKGNQENRQAALQLANQKKTLWEQYRRAVGREAKSSILSQINSIDQFLFVNDNIEDPTTHNLLQAKTVDFGYALTIHKSQGSTFTHVLMDDIDVAKASNTLNNAANAMAMVDLGDAGQIADATMEVRSSEDVDLGDLSSVQADSVSLNQTNPNTANVRQQLEYVGVSRATDTVTVISNNVKVEGSPLNPTTNQSSNTINKGVSSISDKTEAYGVEISSGSQEFWSKVRDGWQIKHPQGLVAYRRNGDSPKSFSPETVKEGWIGNPFSTQNRGENTVQQFYDWIVTGNNFGNERATEEFRQAIIEKIKNTPEGSPILYYTELNRPSHATVIGYLVNNKQLLPQVKGENITSRGSEFAKKLTNPGNNLEVVYKGRTFRNAEHAYQTWKSGEFDEVAYNSAAFKPRGSKPVNKQTNYQTMVEIITAKFQQHPELVQGITERGGETYLKASTHNMIGDKYWETKDGQNKFIEALTDAYRTIISREPRSNNEAQVISATIAPYFNTSYKDYVAMTPEKQKEMREAFAKAAHKIADALGVTLDMKKASFNIGGYQFKDGSSVVEPSFTFRLDTTPEKARLFAALMGDLGYEQQEAVVSSYRIENYDEADGVKHFIKYSDSDTLLKLLDRYDIKNFTYDKTRGELSVLSFNPEEVEKLHVLADELNKIENGEKFEIQTEAFKSSYDEKNDRRVLYEEWDTILRKEQGREGYNSQLHSLIQEALKKLQDSTLPIDEGTPAEQPQKVSLPNYEYFTDKYEDTTVDAAWKIPLLKQLDEELMRLQESPLPPNTTENMPSMYDKQREVLEKMDRILAAKSQEDLLDLESEEPKQKKQVEQNLTEFEKMTQQINNLLDSSIISASEIRHVAELVVNSISDTITILQKEEGAAEKFFLTLQSDLDFQNASRREIVEAVGINNLIHRAKLQFDPEQNDYKDFDTIDQADLIIDNWDAIMALASDIFAMTEGYGITRNYDKGGFTTTQAPQVDYDNFNDYNNDPEAMAESEKDEQEHWQLEQRTIDVLNSMSQLVRLALHECYQIDKDGNRVMSKWGIAERVNPRQAVNSILRWTQGSLTLEDMINRMTAKSTQSPWLNQLIERLSDKSGKETDFQSQFFGVFSKHFQPYSVVLLEDGKYHSIPVNSHPALSEAMQTITTQYRIGEHPLLTPNGINRKLLGNDSTTDAKSEFNMHKALASLNIVQDRLSHGEQLDNSMAKEATENLMGVCRLLGYPVTEEMLSDVINEENLSKMTKALGFMVRSLDDARDEQNRNAGNPNAKAYNPFAFGTDNSIGGTLRNFLTPITDTLEDTAVSAFYDSGKMYQSYVTPSFMTKLMNKFRLEGQEFEDFIMKEYGSSEWFKFGDKTGFDKGWRNEWLRLLARDENARKVFDHKVELNFNKHNYMRNMSDAEYTLSLITEYFAETAQKGQSMVPAWFRIPMLSNKPSSEFIKFYSYRGTAYKDEIVHGLHQMFLQELSRIQTVNMRNHSKDDPYFIKNFDSNGKKFNFLPFLNRYLDADESSHFGLLLKKKVNGLERLDAQEEAQLATMVDRLIRQDMEDRVAAILNEWENNGILEAAKNIDGIGTEEAQIRANIENFLWNDNFAAKNILQLTITDIAFYKDAEDLQKRLAQIHAPGIRGNVAAIDYEGNRVSDGTYRTFILQDFDSFKSNIIANIAEVFDRKIAAAPESQKTQMKALKESLVGKDGKYTKINVTDAQGYSSPSSYRKKAFIFGRWSKQAEDIYQKLLKGEYNYTDLETAFQPLKPFVYSHLQKNMGVDNAPITSMPVPFQAKNAEYLLIMADAILRGEETSRPNLLRAVYNVMEDSERRNPTKGIDTVQFESAIKSGLQGRINIHQFLETPGGEAAAYEYMINLLCNPDEEGYPTSEYNTDTYVHEAPYEDYCLQQEVPEHFKNHSQAHGSQIRMITPSDLDLYKNPNADHNDPDNQVFYEWTEPDGTKRKVRADEFRREYENTIAENIKESIDNLASELHIYSNDKKERNIALSKILQREILSSPRYGIDLIQACSIDRETGEFRIPKGDPSQAKRIEQLINSIIKNRVNKQKIAGGPIVQVSNFGTSRQLHIRFNDKNGNLLMTREEYEKNPQKKEISQTDKFNARYGRGTASTGQMSYEEYVRENQAGIAYFEVFIPIWANELFEKFSNEDGTINMEAIEATDPELLKMISYRIPTEDKYSCAPMKVVGFMPREAGDAIMLPYELTEIDDSDFDVDKRYVMRKDIPIIRKKRSEIEQQLFEIANESYKKSHDGKENKKYIGEQVRMFMDNPDKMRHTDNLMRWLYSHYQKIAYTTDVPTSIRTQRDNKIVDMTWAVLTNEMTADKILNPGGFDVPKKMGYMVAAYKNPTNYYLWEQLQQMSIDELKDLSYQDKDLTWADTQVQFYRQNSAAASLIGVFAINKVAHATLESNDILIAVDEVCGSTPFTIADTEFGGRMFIDRKYDQQGNLIGKTLGSLVSASADAVKDPILNLMNVNKTTAGALNIMLRLGMSFEDAALFLSQNVIERVLNEFNRENLTNYQPLSNIIEQHLQEYRDKYKISDDSNINSEPLTKDEMIDGLLTEDLVDESMFQQREATEYKVLLAFQKIRKLTDAIRKPTFATRFNSISSAVGPLIIDNLIIEHKMQQFMDSNTEDGTHFYTSDGVTVDIDDIFYDHPVLREFSRTVDVAKVMFSDMPAGSTGFRQLLGTLPEGLMDRVYNDKKLLDSLSNFYQSYLLVASRMVNPANLKSYIDGFPKYFNEQKFKEKYPDNALIQAIRMNVAKRTGRPYLSINITGIDEAQKEIYRSAWIDLHKDNPELSKRLFEYCFFRAGIGFSPKTFMSLVPTYVKEKLSTDLGNGTQATYVDTYRNFPAINPNVVIDQWIRNNWDNNKLVLKKGGEGTHYIVDTQRGTLIARDAKDIADLKDVKYMKTRHNGQTYLWKQIFADKQAVNFVRVKPLGNNAEYMEMSLNDITKPLSETKDTLEGMEAAELQATSPAEADAYEDTTGEVISSNEQSKKTAELADLLMKQNPKFNRTQALNQIEKMKQKPDLYAGFLVNVFKQKGLNLTKEEAVREFKKLC